jgi:hypothetical protein
MSHSKSSLNDILEGVGVQNAFNDLMRYGYYTRLKKEEGIEEYPQNFIFDIAQVILQSD